MSFDKSDYEEFINLMSKLKVDSEDVKTEEVITLEKGLFLTKKKIKNIIVKKGHYYSLRGLCYYLSKFQKSIFQKQLWFGQELKNKYSYDFSGCELSTSEEYFSLKLKIEYKNSGVIYQSMEDSSITIACKDIPKLISNCTESKILYEKIKEELYEFLPYIYLYVKYIQKIKKDISIGENTVICINDMGIMFNSYNTTVSINFSNLALFEIQMANDKIKLIVFSKDNKIKEYLNQKGESLLDEIFIYEEHLSKLLDIICL